MTILRGQREHKGAQTQQEDRKVSRAQIALDGAQDDVCARQSSWCEGRRRTTNAGEREERGDGDAARLEAVHDEIGHQEEDEGDGVRRNRIQLRVGSLVTETWTTSAL